MDLKNNAPDVELGLTHEQATFLLKNCLAIMRLCFAMVVSIADENISQREKMKKAEKIEILQRQFSNIRMLLRKAGAREKEEGED